MYVRIGNENEAKREHNYENKRAIIRQIHTHEVRLTEEPTK